MEQDSLKYDSLANRSLPKWLTDQKERLTTVKAEKIVMKQDNSLNTSLLVTGVFILLTVAILSVLILRKKKK
jgi:hypothetical protein